MCKYSNIQHPILEDTQAIRCSFPKKGKKERKINASFSALAHVLFSD